MRKSQIPNPKSQTKNKLQISKYLDNLNFGNWDLFGAWDFGDWSFR